MSIERRSRTRNPFHRPIIDRVSRLPFGRSHHETEAISNDNDLLVQATFPNSESEIIYATTSVDYQDIATQNQLTRLLITHVRSKAGPLSRMQTLYMMIATANQALKNAGNGVAHLIRTNRNTDQFFRNCSDHSLCREVDKEEIKQLRRAVSFPSAIPLHSTMYMLYYPQDEIDRCIGHLADQDAAEILADVFNPTHSE